MSFQAVPRLWHPAALLARCRGVPLSGGSDPLPAGGSPALGSADGQQPPAAHCPAPTSGQSPPVGRSALPSRRALAGLDCRGWSGCAGGLSSARRRDPVRSEGADKGPGAEGSHSSSGRLGLSAQVSGSTAVAASEQRTSH